MIDPITGRIGQTLGILSQLFRTRVEHSLSPYGLTYTQFSVLSHLVRTGAATIGDIADAVELNQPGVTKVVQRMTQSGLLAAGVDPDDARRRRVEVTEAGQRIFGDALGALSHDANDWFDGWSDHELEAFATGVERLTAWLDSHRP